jgi:hypothetical protein
MEKPADGALGVFTTRAAERFAQADPFITGGAVATWDITGWRDASRPAGPDPPLIPSGSWLLNPIAIAG